MEICIFPGFKRIKPQPVISLGLVFRWRYTPAGEFCVMCQVSIVNEYEFCVSLRITHPKIDPDEITKVLGITPTHKWKFGESRKTPKGTQLSGNNIESYWTARLHDKKNLHSEDITLEEFISKANRRLRSYKEYLKKLSNDGGRIEYFVGWFGSSNMGANFKPSVLKDTAELGIEIALDVYPDDQREKYTYKRFHRGPLVPRGL